MADVSNENRDYKYSEDEGFEGYEYIPEEGDDGLNENDIASRALAVLGHFSGKRNSRNERHGFGRTILPNGDAYVGMYTNDQRQGYGEYIFKNGGKYNGCYKHNLRNGNGIMHYPDKSKYDGQWYDNDKDGVGTFTYNNGDKYQGSWKCDMKHGVGTYSFCKSKAVLKGVWSNGKRVSNFEFYFPTSDESGFTFHGVWDDNENVAGEGYFVFEDLMCMQRGIHVNNNNYYSLNSNNVWLSTDMHGNTDRRKLVVIMLLPLNRKKNERRRYSVASKLPEQWHLEMETTGDVPPSQ
ncbi:MORN motif [Cinara cedri]|uniref:MORN motif n=1 Tax=Cinara cedri TaxID=506608 RepID=A0A5E4M2Y9_9HEMI|nr:MORN motif [Cinara cedri]